MHSGISVIIPTYNREKYITETILSVLNQEYQGEIEIIISDDGSSDNTLVKAKQLGNKVRIVPKPRTCRTQGASGARNRGISASTQPFICFLDSDDFFLPGHLKKMSAVLESNPELGFVFCRSLEVREENQTNLYKPWTHLRINKNDISNPTVSRAGIVNTNTLMFRRDVFESVGYFDETISNAEDIDLWMRISEKYQGAFADHYGAVYRTEHGHKQLTKNSSATIDQCVLSVHKSALARYYTLGLNDKNRAFELNHMILHRQYSRHKMVYLFRYSLLIAKYPGCFLRRLPVVYQEKIDRKKIKETKDLQYFL